MPPTTGYKFGDVVLVPFPFTDQTGTKKRPAIIVSSQSYNQRRRDLIIMAVTSQIRPTAVFGEVMIGAWQKAGLLQSSVTKPILATIEKNLVIRKLGQLQGADHAAVRRVLGSIFG
jgi:mRNA interferase MazF